MASSIQAAPSSQRTFRPTLDALNGVKTDPNAVWQGRNSLPEDHPLLKLREERFQLDFGIRKRIAAVLSESQRDEVPSELQGSAQFIDDAPWGL